MKIESVNCKGKFIYFLFENSEFSMWNTLGMSGWWINKDEKHSNYFVYFNFFVFSMLLLVMSSNFLVMFFGWELVGLSSYLLISFWSQKPAAAKAGNKAFMVL